MFKPARMTRVLVGGHRDRLDEVVSVLHDEGVVHLEDFRDPTDITKPGSPLEAGDQISDLLVRVRGLQKALDVEAVTGGELPVDDAVGPVQDAEAACLPVIERLTEANTRVSGLDAEIAQLNALRGLDVDLGALRTVTAVRTYIGTVREDPTGALDAAGIDHDTYPERTPAGLVAVTLVRPDDAGAAERVLADAGFAPVQVPAVDGTPDQAIGQLEAARVEAAAQLAEVEAERDRLTADYGHRLAALERFLAAEADKTAAPLRFAVTANTFHVEGWVPADRRNHLENVLAAQFGDELYIEDLGDAPMESVGDGHDAHDDHHEVSVDDEAPTHLTNKGPARNYQFLLGLLAMPRYKELDPTKLMAIFFPLFFGLMVGDFAIGLIIMGIALWLRKGNIFGIGGPGVAKPMFWGGFWAMLIGLVIFGEALGLHFVLGEEALEDGEHSWESVLGVEFPHEGFIHKTDAHHGDAMHSESHDSLEHAYNPADDDSSGAGLPVYQVAATEGTENANPLAPHGGAHLSVNGWFNLGYYSKIHDVEALLIISVLIGLVHLVLGLVLGVRNVYVSHGAKLAVQEKVSWLLIIASTITLVLGMQAGNAAMTYGSGAVFLVAVALLWMGVQHTIGVGFIAILEIPGLLGNLLSYTRLAAIGASKAGMAVAFATIGFELIGGVGGWIVYLGASGLIIVLAILAGFLQSLRLQFVEFFSKFYEGGGRTYSPFGQK